MDVQALNPAGRRMVETCDRYGAFVGSEELPGEETLTTHDPATGGSLMPVESEKRACHWTMQRSR